ncbi:AbrB/MazE/SpoVT family DNA-binding domain-containing protein [Cystobacter fuscus]|uniref:AbrB/MazE/SpoVT family DNA-binding domain-containing protein n=1 Tax=Cystobacter fuscus TaxID=43 RepID=UPI002B2DEBF3|nr:AbrB/MazE/SpoVT family DNA-binding domain-containing protein [Cystobacter fuscus]
MRRTLTTIGNDLGLIIDRSILELLHIDKDTPLEIETDGKSLTIRPVTPEEQKSQVGDATKRMMDAHDKTLHKLAK